MTRTIAIALALVGMGVMVPQFSAVPLTKAPAPDWIITPDEPPYSCRRLYDEQKKCAFGSCDERMIERLRNECLRDSGDSDSVLVHPSRGGRRATLGVCDLSVLFTGDEWLATPSPRGSFPRTSSYASSPAPNSRRISLPGRAPGRDSPIGSAAAGVS